MKIKVLSAAMISIFLLAGCTWFTPPLEQPVIEEKLNSIAFSEADVGTLSLTPERRVVLVHFENKRFCAEAPAEVGADISRLLKLAAEASDGEERRAGFEAISATASSNRVLNKRTQGMQLFLANAYFICQMYMNKAITKDELMQLQIMTLNAIAPLIEHEVEFMYKYEMVENDFSNGVGEGSSRKYVPLDINRIQRGIEENDTDN